MVMVHAQHGVRNGGGPGPAWSTLWWWSMPSMEYVMVVVHAQHGVRNGGECEAAS